MIWKELSRYGKRKDLLVPQLSSLFVAIFFPLLSLSPLQAKDVLALVVRTEGNSWLLGKSGEKRILINDLLRQGDRIRLEKSAGLNVQFSSGVVCRIGSHTKETVLLVDTLEQTGKARKTTLTLLSGEIAVSSSKLDAAEELHVNTPTAVAGVRGTQFIVDSTSESTSVLVNQGAVEVQSQDGQQTSTVESGNKAIVDAAGLRTAILEKFEKDRFEIMKGLDESRKKNFEALIELRQKNMELMERQRGFQDNLIPSR